METGLTIAPDTQISKHSDADFDSLAKVGSWLPRISVMGANTKLVSAGKTPIGTIAVITSNDNFVNVGKSIDCLFCAWRPRAMDMMGATPISYFDKESKEFKATMAKSEIKDSSCVYGPEFLVWIPSLSKFATFLLGSKSARMEGQSALSLLKDETNPSAPNRPGPGTIAAQFIAPKNSKFQWWGPKIMRCNTPLSPLPEQAQFDEVLNTFLNPPASEIEKDDAPATGRER